MNLSLAVQKNYGGFTLGADIAMTGDRVGIFGPSGSGKSTLVAMLAGLVTPDCGEIVLDGDCLFSSTSRVNQPPDRRRIAMVFQQHELFPHLNVRKNLLYGQKRCAPEYRRIDFDSIVEVLQIASLLDRPVDGLSGGEKQRVSLGRAILSNPRLLLMDEPLSALDDRLRFQIIPYLRSVSEQFAIPYLFISHSLVEMRLMADSVIVMEQGRVAAQTTPEELAQQRLGTSPVGYINLLRLADPTVTDGLASYAWGDTTICLTAGSGSGDGLFELSSKDIILCKQHPQAISARNLLAGRVLRTFPAGRKRGVEIGFGDQRLIAEIVSDAARELAIVPGIDIYAVIKASAFRRLAA